MIRKNYLSTFGQQQPMNYGHGCEILSSVLSANAFPFH